jgi:recombination protein RecR
LIFGSPLLTKLVALFKKMPGVGEKSAQRMALFILRSDRAVADELARTLMEVKERVGLCEICGNVAEETQCVICRDARRSDETICIVEQPQDIYMLERTGAFRGRYQVLHGVLSPMDGVGPSELRLGGLRERVETGGTKEVVVATNPTVEGEATALYVSRLLEGLSLRVTRLARGLPVGGSIEFLDEATLGRAFEGRQDV